ncbi:MAG: hypothetical protein IT384_01880 [Deltaproteobacteria bacterium]|nr:hypothetical protein [Deltaproteobacteria bacterium]
MPSSGSLGDIVVISGSGFALDAGANQVVFSLSEPVTAKAHVLSASADRLEVVVPLGNAGGAKITVTAGGPASAPLDFTILPLTDPTPNDPGSELTREGALLAALIGSADHELGVGLYPFWIADGGQLPVDRMHQGLIDLQALIPAEIEKIRQANSAETLAGVDALLASDSVARANAELVRATQALSHSQPFDALENMRDAIVYLQTGIEVAHLAQLVFDVAGPILIVALPPAAAILEIIDEILDLALQLFTVLIHLLQWAPIDPTPGSLAITDYVPDFHLNQHYYSDRDPDPDPGVMLMNMTSGYRGVMDFRTRSTAGIEADLEFAIPDAVRAVLDALDADVDAPHLTARRVECPLAIVTEPSGFIGGFWDSTESVLRVAPVAPTDTPVTVRLAPSMKEMVETCAVVGVGGAHPNCFERQFYWVERSIKVLPRPRLDSLMPASGFIGDHIVGTGEGLTDESIPFQDGAFTPPSDPAFGDGQIPNFAFSDTQYTRYDVEVPDAISGEHWIEIDQIESNRLPFTVLDPRLTFAHPSAIVGEAYPITGQGFSHHLAHDSASFGGGLAIPDGPGSAMGPDHAAHNMLHLIVPDTAQTGPFQVTVVGELVTNTIPVEARHFSPTVLMSDPFRHGVRPATARAPDGRSIVAWLDQTAGARGHMLVVSTQPGGDAPWSVPVVVARDVGGIPSAPPRSAAAAGPSGFRLAYVALEGARDVIRTVSSTDGVSWTAPLTISQNLTEAVQPTVAVLDNGLVVFAWIEEAGQEGAPSTLVIRRLEADGATLLPEYRVPRPADMSDPAVAAKGDVAAIVWSEETANTSANGARTAYHRELFGFYSTGGRASFGTSGVTPLTPGAFLVSHPSLAISDNPACPDRVYLTFDTGNGGGIGFMRWSGAAPTVPTLIGAQNANADLVSPAVVGVDEDCTPTIAWLEQGTRFLSGRAFTSRLYFARSFDGGASFNLPHLKMLEYTSVRVGPVAMSVSGHADITLAWQDDCLAQSGPCSASSLSKIRATVTTGEPAAPASQPPFSAEAPEADWVFRAWSEFPGSGRSAIFKGADLYASLADGTRLLRLTRNGYVYMARPGLSTDQRQLAFTQGLPPGLRVADADATNPIKLTQDLDGVFPIGAFWSADDQNISYSTLFPADNQEEGSQCESVTRDGSLHRFSGSCLDDRARRSPDLLERLDIQPPFTNGHGTLTRGDSLGDNPVAITSSGQARAPAWSLYGRAIAFESDRDGNEEIYLTTSTAAPGAEVRFTSDPREDTDPAFLGSGSVVVRTREIDDRRTLRQLSRAGGRRRSPRRAGRAASTWPRFEALRQPRMVALPMAARSPMPPRSPMPARAPTPPRAPMPPRAQTPRGSPTAAPSPTAGLPRTAG